MFQWVIVSTRDSPLTFCVFFWRNEINVVTLHSEIRRRAPFPSEELQTKTTSPISFVRILRTSLHLKIRPKDSLTEATLSVKPEGDERREVNRRRAPFHKKARPHMRIVPPKFLPCSSHFSAGENRRRKERTKEQ